MHAPQLAQEAFDLDRAVLDSATRRGRRYSGRVVRSKTACVKVYAFEIMKKEIDACRDRTITCGYDRPHGRLEAQAEGCRRALLAHRELQEPEMRLFCVYGVWPSSIGKKEKKEEIGRKREKGKKSFR
jgi:hypothetical protein